MTREEAIKVLAQAIILLITNSRIDVELYNKLDDIAWGYIDDEVENDKTRSDKNTR